MVELAPNISPILRDVLFDPQTSGGLLMGCPAEFAVELKQHLVEKGAKHTAIVGKVNDKKKEIITIV
jgi:selenide,water dikinase